jgi:hypothetical protein
MWSLFVCRQTPEDVATRRIVYVFQDIMTANLDSGSEGILGLLSPLLDRAYMKAATNEVAVNNFRKSGLFIHNRSNFKYFDLAILHNVRCKRDSCPYYRGKELQQRASSYNFL